MVEIEQFEFNEKTPTIISKSQPRFCDWPVVYIIRQTKHIDTKKNVYIGESCNVDRRVGEHLKNKEREVLDTLYIVFDATFNKSAILDIEQHLIRMFSAEEQYSLQNKNPGLSPNHDYYERKQYRDMVGIIWDKLIKMQIVETEKTAIEESALFKFSPYTALTHEQHQVCSQILQDALNCFKREDQMKCASVITAPAGTGKTILAVKIAYLLNTLNQSDGFDIGEMDLDESTADTLKTIVGEIKTNRKIQIGFVVPMTSLRETLKEVFHANGLSKNMVIGPYDVFKKDYDILIVDEVHRLRRIVGDRNKKRFKDKCDIIYPRSSDSERPDNEYDEFSQLDWIIAKSRFQVLFYDPNQSVKSSDMTKDQYMSAMKKTICKKYELRTQIRCKSGNKFTDFIDSIFKCTATNKEEFDNYEFKLYDDPNMMIKKINEMDSKDRICRTVAGYSWNWLSKKSRKNRKDYDICFNDQYYKWNVNGDRWLLNDIEPNEIGCIYTVQGFDISIVGVILGPEIDYDKVNNKIEIYRERFCDPSKKFDDDENLNEHILNIYRTMMVRGVHGCYVYACNESMQEYLSQFIEKEK